MPDGITIEMLDPENIEDVAPLWKALLDHVAELPDAIVPIRPFEQSWPIERREMLETLAGDAFALVARRGGKAVGYLFVRIEGPDPVWYLSLIHISEPTRRTPISYAVFCLKKKKKRYTIRER